MPRPKKAMPSYRYHVSGQAVVTLGGKDFYLGPHNSPESHAKYLALVGEYQRNGLRPPEQESHQADKPLTIAGLVADFKVNGVKRLTPSGNHRKSYERLATLLVDEHGDEPAAGFGPRKLEEIRSLFIASGNCRRYANEQTGMICRIFKWAVSRELVTPEQLVALQSLEPLKAGEAKDNPPRQPVDAETVKQTLPLLDTVVADMVKIQLATGCRPTELFSLVPAEVDRRGDEWVIRKRSHKTHHHGKVKNIPVVGFAKDILAKYLLRDADDLCFVTSKGTPWNKDNYRRHIVRRCERHKIPEWSPSRIRKTVAQQVRDSLGAEYTQVILGHSRISMIETYSKAAEAKAIEAARKIQDVAG